MVYTSIARLLLRAVEKGIRRRSRPARVDTAGRHPARRPAAVREERSRRGDPRPDSSGNGANDRREDELAAERKAAKNGAEA